MKTIVSNQQTQAKVSITQYRKVVERLADGVFENLLKRMPAHLSKQKVQAFAQRGSLSVSIVSNQKIQSLNKKWRQKNSATDVLSFSLLVEDDESLAFALLIEDMPLDLGEIIISAPRARLQAEQYGHSFDREMAFLFVHGFLHVLGFDHMTAHEEKEMFSRQNEILLNAGFPRLSQ
ncbi:MAG: rRNA maturation RNase YbeY [Candidatus Obscuribacterales bacterium]|nr:rRNA maturation RNase YbeY [Candidatus Obscuribacterales bacterium]